MTLKWKKPDDKSNERSLNPAVTFRTEAVSRIIANDLGIREDDIWWLVLIDPAIKPAGTSGNKEDEVYSINEIYLMATEAGFAEDVAVPPVYERNFRSDPAPGPISLYARRTYIRAANTPDNKSGIKWLEVGGAFRQDELTIQDEPFSPSETEKVPVEDGTVVMAVIDSGMAVGHELFRETDGGMPTSRMAYYWNMDGSAVDTAPLPPGSIEPTWIGNGWTAVGLTHCLRENMHQGLLDDAGFYAAIGTTDWGRRKHTPVAHRQSHGTHVMGLCAGYPSNDQVLCGLPGKRPIIAVNLRAVDVRDPSGNLFVFWLEQALVYIIDRYKRFVIGDGPDKGKHPPLVINFSFGNFAGPHDGTSLIERQIDAALQQARNLNVNSQFVLPAGNGNQSRCHARIELTSCTPSQSLPWQVQPADRSVSAVQLWLDDGVHNDTVTLKIKGPGGLGEVDLSSAGIFDLALLTDDSNKIVGVAFYLSPLLTDFDRGYFGVYLFATDSPEDVGPFAPAGVWDLTVEADVKKGTIGAHFWIERDETLPGFFEFGRQSYFNEADYARFYEPGVDANALDDRLIGAPLNYDPANSPALVRRTGTLSGFAGGEDAILVAGFVEASDPKASPMALYSSTGFELDGSNVYPDTSARSDDSPLMRGVLSAGSASGSFVALDGTSVSAPQVARWVADQLAQGDPGGPVAVALASEAMDPTDPSNTRKPPPERTGCGRMLDLPRLFGQKR
ncbi:MAG: S8 family serine peptidase [Pseudomonadota bacterium]